MWGGSTSNEILLTIKKIGDQLLKEIKLNMNPKNVISDVKRFLLYNYSLEISHQILKLANKNLNDEDCLNDLSGGKKFLTLELIYTLDSDEEIRQAESNSKKTLYPQLREENNFNQNKWLSNFTNINQSSNRKNEEFNQNSKYLNKKRYSEEDQYKFPSNLYHKKNRYQKETDKYVGYTFITDPNQINNLPVRQLELEKKPKNEIDFERSRFPGVSSIKAEFRQLKKKMPLMLPSNQKKYFDALQAYKTGNQNLKNISIQERPMNIKFNIDENEVKVELRPFENLEDLITKMIGNPNNENVENVENKEINENNENIENREIYENNENNENIENTEINQINENIENIENIENKENDVIKFPQDHILNNQNLISQNIEASENPEENANFSNNNKSCLTNFNSNHNQIKVEEITYFDKVYQELASEIESKNNLSNNENSNNYNSDYISKFYKIKEEYINNSIKLNVEEINTCKIEDGSFPVTTSNYIKNEVSTKVEIQSDKKPPSTREQLSFNFEDLYTRAKNKKGNPLSLKQDLDLFTSQLDAIDIDENFLIINEKLNIVLDIDNTLLYADLKNTEHPLKDDEFKDENVEISRANINGKEFFFKFKLRKGLKKFFEKVEKFSNFYINTHGVNEYGYLVGDLLKQKFNILIPPERIVGRKEVAQNENLTKSLKQFPDLNKRMAIIIDDKSVIWYEDYLNVTQCLDLNLFLPKKLTKDQVNMIFSKVRKFNLPFRKDNNPSFTEKFTNPLEFVDGNLIPCFVEYDYSEKFQFDYMHLLYERVYKIVSITRCN
jgi:hypothetical protein